MHGTALALIKAIEMAVERRFGIFGLVGIRHRTLCAVEHSTTRQCDSQTDSLVQAAQCGNAHMAANRELLPFFYNRRARE
jgi:hypothetical protein